MLLIYICIDEHEGDEAFGFVGALSFSLILPLFLFVMLFAIVTALHSGQKKERIRLCISFETRERRRMET